MPNLSPKTLSFSTLQRKLEDEDDGEKLAMEISKFLFLERLILSGNTISTKAAKPIASALEEHPELRYAIFADIFTGRLKTEIPVTLKCLCDAMYRAGTLLTELDLSDNAIGPMGFPGIEDFLASASAFNLQVLKLNNTGMGSATQKLAKCLLEVNRKSQECGKRFELKVLVLGRNRVEHFAQDLANALKEIGTLEEIHMPQNGITKDGIVALAKAFKSNHNLRVINLNDNTFGVTGARAMAKTIGSLRKLEVADFGDCLCRRNGSIAICTALRDNGSKIKELNLSGNEIDADTAKQLIAICEELVGLSKLSMNTNCFGRYFNSLSKYAQSKLAICDFGEESDDQGSLDASGEESNEESDQELEPPTLAYPELAYAISFLVQSELARNRKPDAMEITAKINATYRTKMVEENLVEAWIEKLTDKDFEERHSLIRDYFNCADC